MSEHANFTVAHVYNRAAAGFDSAPLSFWSHHGARTVECLHLSPGESVLDVACGTGSSAIPAAMAVGSAGPVTAVDLADGMLDAARTRAGAAGLTNIRFIRADMTSLEFPDNSFDAVICVFGIFFVPDMTAFVQELWRMVKPDGRLAVTSWTNGRFEPLASAMKDAVRQVRPDLAGAGSEPWHSIGTPRQFERLLVSSGMENVEIELGPYEVKIGSPDDWWTIVMGSGSRRTMDLMQPDERESVRSLVNTFIASNNIASIPADAIYARGQKAAGA